MLTEPTEVVIVPDIESFQDNQSSQLLNPQERFSKMVKFRDEIDRYHKNKSQVVNKLRLKQILQNRYPHGVHGV